MIPTRERCGLCHQISAVGFWVPNEVWAAVVHPHYAEAIHCLRCFTDRADEKLVPWDSEIKLYPVSRATHLQDVRGLAVTTAQDGGSDPHHSGDASK